jgi:hypothetical protein
MAQPLGSLVALSRGPEFNSQQLHGGSQPSIMGLHKINKFLKRKKERERKREKERCRLT